MKYSKEYRFNKEMLNLLDEFNDLYSTRPIPDNSGGMKSAHLFPLFFYLKKRNPKLIIESGVYKGQGTWLIRKCCPDSKIVSIDIDLSQRVFIDSSTTYYDKDITKIDIKNIIDNFHPDDILVFFDDHQDFNKRLKFLLDNNLKHVIYEDNYPHDQGDCISPKKILESERFMVNKIETWISPEEREEVIQSIEHYEEFPPIFVDSKTRWGNNWNYNTRENLIDAQYIEKYRNFYNERFDYTWICYLQLKTTI